MVTVKVARMFLVTGAIDLDAHTDAVMEELLALEDTSLTDADVQAELAKCVVGISITATSELFDDAVVAADSAIRSAIHAAGGHTPNWNNAKFVIQKQEAELVTA